MPSLLGLRIQGRANQRGIKFKLLAGPDGLNKKLDSLRLNVYYKIRGRIGGGSNQNYDFTVEHIKFVSAAPLKPSEFVGRKVSLEGVAVAGGAVQIHQEKLQLKELLKWPENVLGKRVRVQGSVLSDQMTLKLDNPTWKLVDLADMIGQKVSLKGTLWSLNGHWWFDYRGERLYLMGEQGPPLKFYSGLHGCKATVSGNLVQQLRPSLHQISSKKDRDLVETYVVRGAIVPYPDNSKTSSDRVGTVYPKRSDVQAGVPELIAERAFDGILVENETTSMRFAERNVVFIDELVQDATPRYATCSRSG